MDAVGSQQYEDYEVGDQQRQVERVGFIEAVEGGALDLGAQPVSDPAVGGREEKRECYEGRAGQVSSSRRRAAPTAKLKIVPELP